MPVAEALVQHGARDLRLTEIPWPDLMEVVGILRVEACGLCGSDIEALDGESGSAFPRIMGHEIVGTVEALAPGGMSADSLTHDLEQSRDHGLAHIADLVEQWTPRISIPSETIRHYLTRNIHYTLDTDCIRAIQLFRQYAAEVGSLPPLATLRFL